MGKITEIRNFASLVAGEPVIIPHYRKEWGLTMADSKPRLQLPQNLDAYDAGDKQFRADFIKRCPMARGFAHVTLSILHEVGHHFNREIYLFYDDSNYMPRWVDGFDINHYSLPYEIVATEWAIKWLQNPEHRKQAKNFERKYFGYGKQ